MSESAGKKTKAIKSLARMLYGETDMAEDFSELTDGERAHYFDLAEKCFSRIASIYGLDDSEGQSDDAVVQDSRPFHLPEKFIPFRELAVGMTAVLVDRIDNGDGEVEIRIVLFRRAEGVFSSLSEPEGRFIPSYRLGMIQGAPGQTPRYSAFRDAPILNATDAGVAVFPVEIGSLKNMRLPDDPKARKAAKRKA